MTKPHIKRVAGRWYAFMGTRWAKRLLLVPAIGFCNRLNQR